MIKTVINIGTGTNGTFLLGNDIQYKFTITNTGNLTLNNFVITDPLLSSPIINIPGILLPGQTTTVTVIYKITAADIAAGRVNNQATISATDVNNNPFTDLSGTTVNADDITVTLLAKPPIAVDDIVPIKENQTKIIDILKNDIGVSSNLVPGSVVIKTQPTHGTVTVNANGTVTYTPNPAYLGNDLFTYTVTDANGMTSNVATVTITVGKTTPLAVDDNAKTDINKSVKVNVISNDVPDGFPFVISTLKIIAQPQQGTVADNGDGTYTYTPNQNFAGNDEFTYNVEDANGNVTNIATVKIVVDGFFVPNVFTPNGDGVNDTFEIVGKENYTSVELEIFNRWGNQVYKNANYQNQWVAEGLNEGTYFYTLKVKSASDSKFVKGWVLIKR